MFLASKYLIFNILMQVKIFTTEKDHYLYGNMSRYNWSTYFKF